MTTDKTNPKDLIGTRKTPLRLVPAVLMIRVARVMALGAKKYSEWNWRGNQVRHTVYLEAGLRHILQALCGEDADPESGEPHEAHVAACMGIILDAKATGNLIDDRTTCPPAIEMLRTMAPVEDERRAERLANSVPLPVVVQNFGPPAIARRAGEVVEIKTGSNGSGASYHVRIPNGFVWRGENRKPKAGEIYLGLNGRVREGEFAGGEARPILYPE